MKSAYIIACLVLGFVVVLLTAPRVIAMHSRFGSKRARERHHLHSTPVSRFGGVALVGAFVAVELFIRAFIPDEEGRAPEKDVAIGGSLAMFCLGLWDDVSGLPARVKIAGQVLIALVVCGCGLRIKTLAVPWSGEELSLGVWGLVGSVVWLVGVTNAVNLIDGIDGLAGGVGLMLMGVVACIGMAQGTVFLAPAGLAGALSAFLCFNFPPARIYLGDGGAYFIGFQAAVWSVMGSREGSEWEGLAMVLFVLGLPILDSCLAVVRRGLKGVSVLRADCGHIHHRLLRRGMTSRQAVLWLYGMTGMFLGAGGALVFGGGRSQALVLGLAVVILVGGGFRLGVRGGWSHGMRRFRRSLKMRSELGYARSLLAWLRHETRRGNSLEELAQDLFFAARKLGFTSVKVRLCGTERTWTDEVPCARPVKFLHEFDPLRASFLELSGPGCDPTGRRDRPCVRSQRSCPGDWEHAGGVTDTVQLYEVMADLLAAAWQHGLARADAESSFVRPEKIPAEPESLVRSAHSRRKGCEVLTPLHCPLTGQDQGAVATLACPGPRAETRKHAYET